MNGHKAIRVLDGPQSTGTILDSWQDMVVARLLFAVPGVDCMQLGTTDMWEQNVYEVWMLAWSAHLEARFGEPKSKRIFPAPDVGEWRFLMIPFQATTSLHDAVVLSFDLKACASKSSQLRLATQVRRGKGCIFLLGHHSNSRFEWLWRGIGILWSRELQVSSCFIDWFCRVEVLFFHVTFSKGILVSWLHDFLVVMSSCGTFPVMFSDEDLGRDPLALHGGHENDRLPKTLGHSCAWKNTPWDIILNPKQQTVFHSTEQGV